MRWFSERHSKVSEEHPLANSVLLNGLSNRDREVVFSFMHERHFLPGEVIFDQGEEGQALYFVLRGGVAIRPQGSGDGVIARLEPGSFFGEMGLIDDWPRSAQAVALIDTDLLVLFRGDFERLMESHARIASRIAMQLARHLGQRLRGMIRQPVEFVTSQS
jgi:CRP/FNR family transcriptional regulator, cyclic AMP receptor protein